MPDFSSALYLGMEHPRRTLGDWRKLTTGVPAALAERSDAVRLAAAIARLQGYEAATMASSTLHAFWDLFGMLSERRASVLLDSGAYSISRWGLERFAARGRPVHTFPHHDADGLKGRLRALSTRSLRPVVVCDGFCPDCGMPAPVKDYANLARRCGGWLVIDDTQALGILGADPDERSPWGSGGGGILRWSGVESPGVWSVSSLAKAFGVPIAVVSAGEKEIAEFRKQSQCRVYSSPPSAVMIRAGSRALELNRRIGTMLRRRLLALVHRFRQGLSGLPLRTSGYPFPVQVLRFPGKDTAYGVYEELLRSGVRPVLGRGRISNRVQISFLLRAQHTAGDLDKAVRELARITLEAAVPAF